VSALWTIINAAFAALYRRRRVDVYRFALHMSASTDVAEEMNVIDGTMTFALGPPVQAALL